MNIETKLLKITAQSRYRIMKKIWNLSASYTSYNINRELITDELTLLRNEIFQAIASSDLLSAPICREIAEDAGIPQVRKSICILAVNGISEECLADLNCVNVAYARMCIKCLKEDYPELFR